MESVFVEYKPVFVVIHAFLAALGIGSTVTTDFLLLQFLRDNKISHIESVLFRRVSKLFPILLVGIIISGLCIYLSHPEHYLASSKFIIKMLAVAVILINGTVLHWYVSPHLRQLDFTHHRFIVLKRRAFACGAVSVSSWLSSYLLGSVPSVPFPLFTGLALYACIVLLAVCGSQLAYFHKQYI